MPFSDYERFWNEISPQEETDYDDEKINRLLRFREVEQHLSGVRRILDVGAGTGAFSIPLARMGYDVVHLDISEGMLELAHQKAAGLPNIRFVKADAGALDMFSTDEFDLVLCFDGAISFSGRNANRVIAEICRVGRKALLSVSSRACMAATWLNYSMEKLGRMHSSVRDMLETGYFCSTDYPDGATLTSIAELKAYAPEELRGVLTENDMDVLECRSIGSLTHLYLLHLYRQYPAEAVREKIEALSRDGAFLDMCEHFDRKVMPEGMGSFRRAGLLAVAQKKAQCVDSIT